MKQLPENLLHEGYILIPKALLKRQINDKAPGELEALLQVLIHANYSETTYKIQQIDIVCQRGESVISQQQLLILRIHTGANSSNGADPKPSASFKKSRKRALSRSSRTRKESSTFISTTMISGPAASLRKPAKKKRKKNPKCSTFSGINIMKRCKNPNSTSPVPAANGTSSPKRNNRQPSTTSRKSTTTPTTHVSSPLPPPT